MIDEPQFLPGDFPPPEEDAPDAKMRASFPVVGAGASAGGLEALTQFLGALPADTGMGFVVVQHLAPGRESSLAEILSRVTPMPVREVRDELAVEPDHVYIVPPGQDMVIAGGKLRLLPQERQPKHRGIDLFFRSLAEACGHQAIGVVLSGGASDGTLGLEAIKAEGGITFAQDDSAPHTSMPRTAIASGCVDFILPPEEIAREIARIARHPYVAPGPEAAAQDEQVQARIVQIVQRTTGVDFTHYKTNTLQRRIQRRMVLHKQETLPHYEKFLKETPAEVDALYHDILINVTSFFRNPDAFEVLAGEVFPKLLAAQSRATPLRIWSVGCSTGEEAYSLAMTFTECAEAAGSSVPLQIFATDLSAKAIAKARAGLYPPEIAQDVNPERLRRFFTKENGGFRICKAIRERCVFSRHNVLGDPPFSGLDLISCRNLLIYLDPVLQQRVLALLHYALRPAGFLWLGSSESAGSAQALFQVEDTRHKIFARIPAANSTRGHLLPRANRPARSDSPSPEPRRQELPRPNLHKEAERILLTKYAPPGVVISAALEIVQFRGETGPYLTPAAGLASFHLLKMLREGLLVSVRAAILSAEKEGRAVRQEGLRVKSESGFREVSVEVIPIRTGADEERGYLILFDEGAAARAETPPEPEAALAGSEDEIARLTRELAATREYLQAVIDQQEVSNEELQSANEEAQSANEEMQSVNEELETSKEEIQSSNEELATVNDELNQRNQELADANQALRSARDFAESLVASMRSPLLVLDAELRVKMVNTLFYTTFQVASEETQGRHIYELGNGQWNIPELRTLLQDLLPSQQQIENYEVRHPFQRIGSRIMRLHARRLAQAAENEPLIVLAIEDTTDQSQMDDALRASEERFRVMFELGPVAVYTCNTAGVIQEFNRRATELWGRAPVLGETDERFCGSFKMFRPDGSFMPHEQCPMAEVISGKIQSSDDAEVCIERPDGSRITVVVNIRPLKNARGEITGGINCFYDVTERRVMEDSLVARAAELARADRSKDEFLAMLAHELRNPLAPMRNATAILQSADTAAEEKEHAQSVLTRQIENMSRMIDDLLDVSRITEGKIPMQLAPVSLETILTAAASLGRPSIAKRSQTLTVSLPDEPVFLQADATRLEQVFGNLLGNACKYSTAGCHISLSARRVPDAEPPEVSIGVRDDGMGMPAELLPRIFDLFVQASRTLDRAHGGLGIGLTLVRRLVELHGGSIEAHSEGLGHGSEFVVRLPILRAAPPLPVPAPSIPLGRTETPRRILIVDDNTDAARTLAILQNRRGHETRIAFTGPAAVIAAAEFLPEFVLLDIGLPGMDGFAVARRLRAMPALGGVFLIAMTGYGRDEDRAEAHLAGFNQYLVKPLDLELLREWLGTQA